MNGDSSSSLWQILLATVGGLAAVGISMLYIYQDKLLYMPTPPGMPVYPEDNPVGCITPAEWSTNGAYGDDNNRHPPIPFEDVIITTDDGVKIHAWLLLKDEHAPTLLYFHGNAGNMGFRLQNAAGMYGLGGYNVLMMDYRGYGKSTGIPSEVGLQKDAVAVVKFIKNHPKLSQSPIVPFGRSLGGAVAIWLAYHHASDISGIIIENTFLSIPAMVDVLMPWATRIKYLILRISWDSNTLIKAIEQPILFISGDSDELVPSFHMKTLHTSAIKSWFKEFYSVAGGTHNDTWARAGGAYYMRLKGFAKKVLQYHKDKSIRPVAATATGDAATGTGKEEEVFATDKVISSLPTMTTSFGVKKNA